MAWGMSVIQTMTVILQMPVDDVDDDGDGLIELSTPEMLNNISLQSARWIQN